MISYNCVRKIYPDTLTIHSAKSMTNNSHKTKRVIATHLILTTDLDSKEIAEKAGCGESLITVLRRELGCNNSKAAKIKAGFDSKKKLAKSFLLKEPDISCSRLGAEIGTTPTTAQRYKKLFQMGEL